MPRLVGPGTGGKDWGDMEKQAGTALAYMQVRSADQAMQMVVGDGNKLYDAITDNGGGMEDALASQKAIVPIDTSRSITGAICSTTIPRLFRDGHDPSRR